MAAQVIEWHNVTVTDGKVACTCGWHPEDVITARTEGYIHLAQMRVQRHANTV